MFDERILFFNKVLRVDWCWFDMFLRASRDMVMAVEQKGC